MAMSARRLSATTVYRPHEMAAQQFFCLITNGDTNNTLVLPLSAAMADAGPCSNLKWKKQTAAIDVVHDELQTHKVGSGVLANSHQRMSNNLQHGNN